MSSNFNQWAHEIYAIARKEWLCEIRTLSGLATTALFALVSVIVIGTATYNLKLSPVLGAGLLWLILVFAGSVTLPRTFIAEEELGTGDLLRLMARPEAVFWGKSLVNAAQMVVTALLVTMFFIVNSQLIVTNYGLLFVSMVAGSLSIAATVTLCGALAAQATNRSTVAAAISIPLLIFLANLGVTAVAAALGEDNRAGAAAGTGIVAYAILTSVVGPYIYTLLWKR